MIRLGALLLAGMLFLGAATARYLIWPDLRPLPPRVDAIIELAGFGDRDETALRLARQGYARYLVQSTVKEEAGTHRCLPPVPDVTILCFQPQPETTRGEAEYIGRTARQFGWRSVIVLTSVDHVKRAELRVSRCFPGEIYLAATRLPAGEWFRQVPYQWAAFAKALLIDTDC